ncbi:MAG: hypothetical protein IJ598_00475 [Ruminococcus sp.]|nr:hypothetical protein [Ruminococcus sp.]
MPFIHVTTSAVVSDEQKRVMENRLSDAISLIPGKSDRYLMLAVQDGVSMMFHRETANPIAMVEVKIFGSASRDAYAALTAAVCDIMRDEAGVDGADCYVKFEECANWGYHSSLF